MSEKLLNKENNSPLIPPPYEFEFENGISHPLLYLWDAWSYMEGDVMHLYCLAVSRLQSDGSVLQPIDRNNFPFHIRHFTSTNCGEKWKDEGCFLKTETLSSYNDISNIWSGSIEALPDGNKLVAFTTIEKVDPNHNFLQNISLAMSSDGYVVDEIVDVSLSSPRKNWEEIIDKGYYMDTPENLGNNNGEGGGPILAWRDPFIFLDKDNKVNLFWGGKATSSTGALVRAEIEEYEGTYKISKLHPPVTVPDGHEFTQLELPKVLHNDEKDIYYLIISSCNRLYEGQPDSEVDKGVRIYKSKLIDGPWLSLGSKILGSENLFGPTVLRTDFKNNRLLCIAPYTDAAEQNVSLTFSPVFYVYLDKLRVEFL